MASDELNRILKAWGQPKAPAPQQKKKQTPPEKLAEALAAMKKGD